MSIYHQFNAVCRVNFVNKFITLAGHYSIFTRIFIVSNALKLCFSYFAFTGKHYWLSYDLNGNGNSSTWNKNKTFFTWFLQHWFFRWKLDSERENGILIKEIIYLYDCSCTRAIRPISFLGLLSLRIVEENRDISKKIYLKIEYPRVFNSLPVS